MSQPDTMSQPDDPRSDQQDPLDAYRPPPATAGSASDSNPLHPLKSSPLRRYALWRIRMTVGILLIPALLNWVCIHLALNANVPRGFPNPLLDLLWVLFLATLIGCSLPLLERIGELLRWRLVPRVSPVLWREALYGGLQYLIPAAIAGSVLWIIWLGLFFFVDAGGRFQMTVTVLLSTLGHAVGASVWGNVLWRWNRLRRQSQQPVASP